MLRNARSVLALTLPLTVAAACADHTPDTFKRADPNQETTVTSTTTPPETLTTEDVGPAFQKQVGEGTTLIGVRKEMLDQELMLSAGIISNGPVPSFNGLRTRIVKFVERDHELQLLDVTDPVPVYGQPIRLLSSFAVAATTKDTLFVDFAQGIDTIFSGSDWYSSDGQSAKYDATVDQRITDVSKGFIEEASLVGADSLYLRMIAQLRTASTSATGGTTVRAPTAEVRFTFTPYRPDPSFVPLQAPATLKNMGFFMAQPLFREDRQHDDAYIARWSTRAPIVFAVSSNTPAQYRQAVKDGVLYWNHAFGGHLVDVIDAPEGVQAPDPRFNMIQWVPYDTAGSAYADAQMDPRTGEVLHANVYLTSTFAIGGRSSARRLLALSDGLADDGETGTAERRDPLASPLSFTDGWASATRCRYEPSAALRPGLLNAIANAPNDELITRAGLDYLTETTAHEVGHTLGLRHNFAGSIGATYTQAELAPYLDSYLKGAELPESLFGTSSVMEYTTFFDAIVSGSRARRGLAGNPYDVAVMRYLYANEQPDTSTMPLFCTDNHTATFLDCQTFDTFGSPVDETQLHEREVVSQLASSLAERYVAVRVAWPLLGVQEVGQYPYNFSDNFYAARTGVLALLDDSLRLLQVERRFPRIDGTNEDAVHEALVTHVMGTIDAAGGLDTLFAPAPTNLATTLPAAFSAYIRRPGYASGTGWGDLPYTFTETELATMEGVIEDYAAVLDEELARSEALTLSTEVLFADDIRGQAIVPVLAERQRAMLLAQNGTTRAQIMIDPEDLPETPAPTEPAVVDVPPAEGAADVPTEVVVPAEAAPVANDVVEPAALPDVVPFEVQLPQFTLPYDVRELAASFLARDRSAAFSWGMAERKAMRTAFEAACTDTASGLKLLDLDPTAQSPEIAEWILTHRALRDALR